MSDAPRWIGREEIARQLSFDIAIPLIRSAMIALSHGQSRQLPRGIVDLDEGRAFGVMPGAMADVFGAKLVSVYPDNFARGSHSHQGVMAIFDPDTGAPSAILEAGEITAIRTAAASAVATDALARPEASVMAVLGYGEQAWRHVDALRHVRPIRLVRVWGRSPERASDFALRATQMFDVEVDGAAGVAEAVEGADIVCTVTAAAEPILTAAMIGEGTHLNIVGSSRDGPAEIDGSLVARARFFADHASSVRAQGAEFRAALAGGLIGEDHLLGEIGEVLDGRLAGRISPRDVTLYKSLGHIVQDLACARHVLAAVSANAVPG